MVGKILYEFLDNPLSGQTFSYNIKSNGVNQDYDNGFTAVTKTYINGPAPTPIGRIARAHTSFSAETAFNSGGTGCNNTVYQIAATTGGTVYAGGAFTTYDGSSALRVLKLNSSGVKQSFFNTLNADVKTICLKASNNYLYVGGDFTNASYNRILRLTPAGTIDGGFVQTNPGYGTGFNGRVKKIVEIGSGQIFVGGDFTQYAGVPINRFVCLLSNGSMDGAYFLPGTFNYNLYFGFDGSVNEICVQSNGKILVGGEWTSFNLNSNANVRKLLRLNSNGTLDTGWNSGGSGLNATASIKSICVDPSDNSVYVGGSFTTYNGVAREGIMKLDSTGALVTNWHPILTSGSEVKSMIIDSNNNLRIVGDFTTINGVSHKGVATLSTASGAAVLSTSTYGYNGSVNTIVQSGSSYFVGGDFATYSDITTNPNEILIGTGLTETQTNTINNLRAYNTRSNIGYSIFNNFIIETIAGVNNELLTVPNIIDIPDYLLITFTTEQVPTVTTISSPQPFTPVYNPISYRVSSPNNSLTGFKYIFKITDQTDSIDDEFPPLLITPMPDGSGYVDIQKILSNKVTTAFKDNVPYQLDCPKAYITYDLSISEQYNVEWPFDYCDQDLTSTTLSGQTRLNQSNPLNTHTYVAGSLIQVDSALVDSQLNGLHTVLAVNNDHSVTIDFRYPFGGLGLVTGTTVFADGRKTLINDVLTFTGMTAFNGARPWVDFQYWNGEDYTIRDGFTGKKLLTNQPQNFYMTPNQDLYIDAYFEPYVIYDLVIRQAGGIEVALLSGIDNGSGYTVNNYSVGPKYIYDGSTPYPEYYDVYFRNPKTHDALTQPLRIYIDLRCTIEDKVILFMDRMGTISSFAFQLRTTQKTMITRDNYKVQRYYVEQPDAYDGGYLNSEGGSTNYNIQMQSDYEMTTNWMDDASSVYFNELMTSPFTYIIMEDGQAHACIVQEKDDEIIRQKNKRLIKKTITVRLSNDNPINI